jgi:hypothetical protein
MDCKNEDSGEKKKKKKKKHSSHHNPKLSDKRGNTLSHKAQNTKHQYRDWTPKE